MKDICHNFESDDGEMSFGQVKIEIILLIAV